MMPAMTMKAKMTMLKCKQCALYLEAQGPFGPTMTSRSEAVISMMIITIITIIMIIINFLRIIGEGEMGSTEEEGEYPFSWWLAMLRRNVIEKVKGGGKNCQAVRHC